MGEFFKKEEREEEKKKEQPLIENPEELFVTFQSLRNKIQILRDEGYEAITPIRTKLLGTGGMGSKDTGQVGDLRKQMENSRITRMTIGITMWSALENVEDLSRWSERYITHSEEFMDNLVFISRSAMQIIANLHKKLNAMNEQMEGMRRHASVPRMEEPVQPKQRVSAPPPEDYMMEEPVQPNQRKSSPVIAQPEEMETDPTPDIPIGRDLSKTRGARPLPQIDVFKAMLEKKTGEYKEAVRSGDDKLIHRARKAMMVICGKSDGKKQTVQKIMDRIDMESPVRRENEATEADLTEDGPTD